MNVSTETSILGRVLASEGEPLRTEAAEFLLGVHFPNRDKMRMDELAQKAREGTLTSEEQREADEYQLVGDVIAILQSKARMALRSSSDS